jgi:hypothetical protein
VALISVLAEECGDVAAVSSDRKNVVFVAIAVLWPVSWPHKIIPVSLGDNIKLLGLIPTLSN